MPGVWVCVRTGWCARVVRAGGWAGGLARGHVGGRAAGTRRPCEDPLGAHPDTRAATAEEARLALESKLFTRFRTVRDAFQRIPQTAEGTIRRRSVDSWAARMSAPSAAASHWFWLRFVSAFRLALREWGVDMCDAEYKRFWTSLDANNDKALSYTEFCQLLGHNARMPAGPKVSTAPNHWRPLSTPPGPAPVALLPCP